MSTDEKKKVPCPELGPEDLEHLHPADTADHLESLDLDDQVQTLMCLPLEDAAEAVGEMEEHARLELLEHLDPEVTADLLEEMAPDDAADVLEDVSAELRERILRRVELADAVEITDLMRYDPDSAGGIMNTEVVVLDQGLTVDQAIHIMRRDIEDKEIPYYAYLVNESEKLVGVCSLRDIMLARPGTVLSKLVQNQNLISVLFDVDREVVAHEIRHYNFVALPVVDYEGKLLGIVTHDDIIDIIHEEASEDMLGMVGAGQDETIDTPWKKSIMQRLPWLIINIGNSALSAYVVHLYEGTIAQMAILAALMPIVTNQGGNTGQQSLAVIVRQLAMETFDRKRAWGAVWRELKIGLSSGLCVGVFVFLVVLAVLQNVDIGLVMAYAVGSNMVLGALAGASIPLILREMGRDPAQASSIFLTTITDCSGFLIFLALASYMLF